MAYPVRALYTVICPGRGQPPLVLSLLINAKSPWDRYSTNGHTCFVFPDLESAVNAPFSPYPSTDEWLYRAARMIWFSDTTGLYPEEPIPSLHRNLPTPTHFDHGVACTYIDGTPFNIDQPYGDPNKHVAELEQLGVSYFVLPREISPYNGGDRRDPASTSYLYTSPIFEKRLREVERKLKAVNLQSPPWHSDIPNETDWAEAIELVDRARRTA